ncbi:MAG: D-2-hydroxyacid dehydrogenase [Gammaproteobacteria bacterium]|nr:D-2-hydroxyacid dehydrogenase [Gammaproteobacteria bacterium]
MSESAPRSDAHAVFLDYATLGPGDVAAEPLLALLPELQIHGDTRPDQVHARLAGAQFVFANKIRFNAAAMDAAEGLRFIGLTATGADNVDLAAARERGIAVCNIRDYCTQSVAQHAIAMMLSLTQQLGAYHRDVVAGRWGASGQFCLFDYPIRELSGRNFAVVGYGVLGGATARIAEAIGMNLLIAARPGSSEPTPAGRLELTDLLRQADVVSLHCPLTEHTRHLIGAPELEIMKPDALLLNTARGGLVDTRALATALRAGGIGGAGIDVLEEEPPVNGSPLIELALEQGRHNLILTPHVAWAAREARTRAIAEVAANVAAFLSGERRNRID